MTTNQAVTQLIPAPRQARAGQRGPTPTAATPPPIHTSPRHLAGQRARISIDNQDDIPFLAALFIAPPPNAEGNWRAETLDSETLDRISPDRLIELLVDLSPEISRALSDFIRMFNPGWECKVFRPNGSTIDKRGQGVIDDLIAKLTEYYGTFDVVLGRLIIGGFLRGAFLAEIVLDGREAVDLATPDPYSVRFKKFTDPKRGRIWKMGQWQQSEFKILDAPTIGYVPIDPLPGSPYGRSMVAPAVFLALFMIGLLHDLRRVIAQQGYPRLDISLDLEKLAAAMPSDISSNPETFKNWVGEIIDEIKTVYTGLEPDDAYVHTSVIAVNRPVGAMDTSSLGMVGDIIAALERMSIRALKTMPFLMGTSESTTETQSNRQWEAYVATIKSIQHLLESLLQRLFKVALQAQGIQGVVEFKFAELRASEMMRDEQVKEILYRNLKTAFDQGWIDQNEAAQAAVGHDAVEEEPRAIAPPVEPEPEPFPADTEMPEAGEESRAILAELRAARLDVARAIEAEAVSRNGHKVRV